ncbi:hypothetical protein ABB02_01879 [Clostridiaceae bacterium JG1575]|nr:hypothetical protein ABB02_01879 [Clostridiaceae bacterium JG1575]
MKTVTMILTNRFDPDVRVYKEARYLVESGYDVEILCWDRLKERPYAEVIDGIRIRRFSPRAVYGTGLKQAVPFVRFLKEVNDYLKRHTPDILHAHDLDGMLVALAYAKSHPELPLVFDMHEMYEVQGKKQKIRPLVHLAVAHCQNKAHHILYVHDMQKEGMSEANKKKLLFLPNYPDASNFQSDEKNQSPLLRISYIGSVRHAVQMRNLLDAAKPFPGVFIAIHGFGTAHDELARDQKNWPNALIGGPYHFSQSTELYQQADLMYLMYPMDTLQNRRAQPVKFFESIITRTPVLIHPESQLACFVLEKDIGYLVNGDDPEDIARMLRHILTHPEELAQKRDNMKALQHDFTWERVVTALDDIYPPLRQRPEPTPLR